MVDLCLKMTGAIFAVFRILQGEGGVQDYHWHIYWLMKQFDVQEVHAIVSKSRPLSIITILCLDECHNPSRDKAVSFTASSTLVDYTN